MPNFNGDEFDVCLCGHIRGSHNRFLVSACEECNDACLSFIERAPRATRRRGGGKRAIDHHPLAGHLRAMVNLLRAPCFAPALVEPGAYAPFWDASEEEAIQAAEAALEEYGG